MSTINDRKTSDLMADGLIHPAAETAARKITIKDLNFFYGGIQALKHVSLDVPTRRVTGLIGPSGCGKSTLLRVLNRLYDLYPLQRVTGEVDLDGEDILGSHVDVQKLRRRIGMVFQQSTVFPMSIYNNIAFGISLQERLPRPLMQARVESALTAAFLWEESKDRLAEPAISLSGGQQQRLCIARALATRPEVMLLDEPTSALDPIATAKIENLIDHLKLTYTIIIVTHNMEQARRCADQVAFFYLGEIVEVGDTDQIFTAPQQRQTRDYITGRMG
jgi:phosphate transport system ATP-binding protein